MSPAGIISLVTQGTEGSDPSLKSSLLEMLDLIKSVPGAISVAPDATKELAGSIPVNEEKPGSIMTGSILSGILSGAATGSVGGPIGTAVGGVLGGITGVFKGNAQNDAIKAKEAAELSRKANIRASGNKLGYVPDTYESNKFGIYGNALSMVQ